MPQVYKNSQNSHTGAGAVRPPVLRRCEETSYVPMRGERSESVPEPVWEFQLFIHIICNQLPAAIFNGRKLTQLAKAFYLVYITKS